MSKWCLSVAEDVNSPLLATDASANITAEIIEALNKRVPAFAALPTVTVKKREKPKAK